ncbi:hypothetical protein GCM10022420_028880 [Streptomyces iranensis]
MDDEPLARVFTDGVKAVASRGVLGNPHGMSSELGFACLNARSRPTRGTRNGMLSAAHLVGLR